MVTAQVSATTPTPPRPVAATPRAGSSSTQSWTPAARAPTLHAVTDPLDPQSDQAPAGAEPAVLPPDPGAPPGAPEPPPAQPLHGEEDPVAAGNVWMGAALSERPGDSQPAPDGWENPPAREMHGRSTPPEQHIWVPRDGGAGSPHELGVTERTAPEGWVNPPALELHGSTTPPT